METKNLANIGLTQIEAQLYLALLDLGQSQAGILSRKTGIHRRSVYDSLERLIEKGLVSYIKLNNKRMYQAANPERLLEILDEKRKFVQEILPELKSRFEAIKEKQETLFYKGKEGLKAIFEDQLNEGKTIHVLSGSKEALEILPFYVKNYTRRRIEKGIKMKIIFMQKRTRGKIPLCQTKYLPEKYHSLASTNIYGDKVAIIHWQEPYLAILIKNKNIASGYQKYFDLLWGIAKSALTKEI